MGFYLLIVYHIDQVIKLSEIKGLQIRAVTLAENKQNELQVVTSHTWGEAETMSDVVSEPEKIQD